MIFSEEFKSHPAWYALACCFVIGWTASVPMASGQQGLVIFQDDFESGIGDWSADKGLWEVGVATAGPTTAHSDSSVAGTVLGGNYPPDADTRLVSPEITLPTLSGHEKNILKFWYWFSTENCCDMGTVQVTTDGATWDDVSAPVSGSSLAWSQQMIDLSSYAGSTIRVGFFFTSNRGSGVSSGWYIDDIEIKGAFPVKVNDPIRGNSVVSYELRPN